MNEIFHEFIDEFSVVYLDDLLVFSKSKNEHYRHLDIVMGTLSEHRLYLGKQKCFICVNEVEFLGMIVSREGIGVGKERVEVVRSWPKPANLTELRSFVGLLQFFRIVIK